MSLSVSVDGKTPFDVATSADWEGLSDIASGEIKTLVEDGYTTNLDKLYKDLEELSKKSKKSSLTETLRALKKAAKSGSDILIIT